jgi:hypothetical protein
MILKKQIPMLIPYSFILNAASTGTLPGHLSNIRNKLITVNKCSQIVSFSIQHENDIVGSQA